MRDWPRGKWAESSERHADVLIISSGAGGATLAAALPNSTYRTLEGQNHMVKAAALAPVLIEFFRK